MQTDTRENILFVRQFSISRSRMIFGEKLLGIHWDSSQSIFETINHEKLWEIDFPNFQNVKNISSETLRVN